MDQDYNEEVAWTVARPGQVLELATLITVPGATDDDPPVPDEPATLTLVIQAPDGTEDERTYPGPFITMPSIGDMRSLYSETTLEGWYWYRWESTEPQTVAEGVFEVRSLRPHLTPP